MGRITAEIERRLTAALAPERLEIVNDSASHRGHAGHRDDEESHFTVHVTSAAFTGQGRVARQRLIYAALGDLMAPDQIHALAIRAHAPGEMA